MCDNLKKISEKFPENRHTSDISMEETGKRSLSQLYTYRQCEKMLAKREKREVYRWHFVNRLVNHFSHLFHRSHQMIGIFTKRQTGQYDKFQWMACFTWWGVNCNAKREQSASHDHIQRCSERVYSIYAIYSENFRII